ncbi:MAG: metallophosphoesterase [Acidobacteriota bacterium]
MNKKLIPILIFAILILISCSSPEDQDSFSFIFMTDVHLESDNNAPEGFAMAINKINSLNPEFVISGGDNIDDALEQDYERADKLFTMYIDQIKKLKMSVYNTPGNHDIFGVFTKGNVDPSHPEYGDKMFIKRLNKTFYSFDFKGWHFIILNTVKIMEEDYIGEISVEQIEWIKNDLQNVGKKIPVAISTHVPFFTIMPQIDKRFKYEKFTISNSQEVLELFKDHNLKFVLQGHVHNYENIYSRGIWFISGGAVCAGWWEGTLHGMEEGFVEFTITGEEFTWKYIDYGWEVPEKKDN